MFNIGDIVFIDDKIHKHYTIISFYTSSGKPCVYIEPNDGVIPDDYIGFRILGRCGAPLDRLTHITQLTPDWEI